MQAPDTTTVGQTYTKGRRQPYLIRKWPGSNWALPMGPYTITQLLVFVGSVYLLFTYRQVWAHFGAANLILGVGVPVALTYATRHTRIEGREPLRAGIALGALLLQPRAGYLNGALLRTGGASRLRSGRFPVAALPAPLVPAAAPDPAEAPVAGRWVGDLVHEAARRTGRR